jgi:putative transposase
MAGKDDEAAVRAERARAIGLFRYQLIREAADPELSTRARGRLVRAIAAREHTNPGCGQGKPKGRHGLILFWVSAALV